MNASSNYLVKKLADASIFKNPSIVIKMFYMDEDGRRAWYDEDRVAGHHYAKKIIIGLQDQYWLQTSSNTRTYCFDYKWKQIGTVHIRLNDLLKDEFNELADTIMMQILLHVDAGNDIWFGAKHCSKQILHTTSCLNETCLTIMEAIVNKIMRI